MELLWSPLMLAIWRQRSGWLSNMSHSTTLVECLLKKPREALNTAWICIPSKYSYWCLARVHACTGAMQLHLWSSGKLQLECTYSWSSIPLLCFESQSSHWSRHHLELQTWSVMRTINKKIMFNNASKQQALQALQAFINSLLLIS